MGRSLVSWTVPPETPSPVPEAKYGESGGDYIVSHPLRTMKDALLEAEVRRERLNLPIETAPLTRTAGVSDGESKSVKRASRPARQMSQEAAISDLRRELRGSLVDRPESLERYHGDASHLRVAPLASVLPRDVEDVQRVVRWARRHRIPIVARGAGTSLDGESVPVEGGIVLDLSEWNSAPNLDVEERTVTVGPGMVNRELQRWLLPHGLFFPPNPGSWNQSTLGGNVATNASGPRSFKYGPTRRWVQRLEAVLGTGDRIVAGNRARKRSTGPDLLQLLIGSEGTLAVLTELTLRVAPVPARRMGLIVSLGPEPTPGQIARRLADGSKSGISALEYLDLGSARQLAAEPGSRLEGDHALLLLEVESRDTIEEEHQLEHLSNDLRSLGISEDPHVYPDADQLWTLRGQSGVAFDKRWGPRIREDVAVPLGAIDTLLAGIDAIARRAGVPVFVYGHLGEGSLHPNYIVDPLTSKAEAIRAELLRLAHELGGTISGEHGIGSLKAAYLPLEVGASAMPILEGIKHVFDPDGILNPGKWLATRGAAEASDGSP